MTVLNVYTETEFIITFVNTMTDKLNKWLFRARTPENNGEEGEVQENNNIDKNNNNDNNNPLNSTMKNRTSNNNPRPVLPEPWSDDEDPAQPPPFLSSSGWKTFDGEPIAFFETQSLSRDNDFQRDNSFGRGHGTHRQNIRARGNSFRSRGNSFRSRGNSFRSRGNSWRARGSSFRSRGNSFRGRDESSRARGNSFRGRGNSFGTRFVDSGPSGSRSSQQGDTREKENFKETKSTGEKLYDIELAKSLYKENQNLKRKANHDSNRINALERRYKLQQDISNISGNMHKSMAKMHHLHAAATEEYYQYESEMVPPSWKKPKFDRENEFESS